MADYPFIDVLTWVKAAASVVVFEIRNPFDNTANNTGTVRGGNGFARMVPRVAHGSGPVFSDPFGDGFYPFDAGDQCVLSAAQVADGGYARPTLHVDCIIWAGSPFSVTTGQTFAATITYTIRVTGREWDNFGSFQVTDVDLGSGSWSTSFDTTGSVVTPVGGSSTEFDITYQLDVLLTASADFTFSGSSDNPTFRFSIQAND